MDNAPIDVKEDHGKVTTVDPASKLSTNSPKGKNELPSNTFDFVGPDFH